MILGSGFSCWLEQRINKRFFVEDLELINSFAHADIPDGNFKLIGYTQGYAALGGSIQFGERKACDFSGF